MFGLKYNKKGMYLFFVFCLVNLLINSVIYLISKKIPPFYISQIIPLFIVYFFSMYYHKKRNIVFSKVEIKNIAYSFQICMAVLMFILALIFIVDFVMAISLIVYLILNYFLIYFFLWIYKKVNKL